MCSFYFTILKKRESTNRTNAATPLRLKMEPHTGMYLIQQEIIRGPREFASAYDKSYQTRAACTTEEKAKELALLLSQDEQTECAFVILNVPLDMIFPPGLPPGTHITPRHESLKTATTNRNEDDLDSHAKTHILEHLQVAPEVYERDRRIREAELMQRRHIQALPAERKKTRR